MRDKAAAIRRLKRSWMPRLRRCASGDTTRRSRRRSRSPSRCASGKARRSWNSSPRAKADALRVGGNIKAPVKVKDVRPVYPPIAREAGVSGVVIIEVRIGTDGTVEEAHVLKSIPLLDQAALDAVKQWQFVPTLLNGSAGADHDDGHGQLFSRPETVTLESAEC